MTEGCYPGCYYYTDSCFRKDCKQVNKYEREVWEQMVNAINDPDIDLDVEINFEAIAAANVHILKLERELQALKNKKTMVATPTLLLM